MHTKIAPITKISLSTLKMPALLMITGALFAGELQSSAGGNTNNPRPLAGGNTNNPHSPSDSTLNYHGGNTINPSSPSNATFTLMGGNTGNPRNS